MSTLPTRKILSFIKKDLERKMVFLGGSRQLGKTTLTQSLVENYHDGHNAYLNWDFAEHGKKNQGSKKEKSCIYGTGVRLKTTGIALKILLQAIC